MDGLKILAVVLLLYGPLGIALAVFEIQAVVWNMGKIEGFESLLGEVGTRVLLGVWGVGGVRVGRLVVGPVGAGGGPTAAPRVTAPRGRACRSAAV